jgi:dCMP deaminase
VKHRYVLMYMDIAERIAKESYAQRLRVGAVFVSKEGVMSIGINGLPAGGDNDCEYLDKNGELATKPEVSHAEENMFQKIMRQGLSTLGGTVFITHAPCVNCAKILVGSGIETVYYKHNYRSLSGVDWIRKNNIKVVKL